MANLTPLPGGSKPRAFSMNARGIANYMESGAYRARSIIEEYAFPDEQKAKIIVPPPTKDLIFNYYRRGQEEQFLSDTISANSQPVFAETKHARSRRLLLVNAAKHLLKFGPKYRFSDVRRRTYDGIISGLRVKASFDFIGNIKSGKVEKLVCVIFNVASEISRSDAKLEHHAKVEAEIAYEIVRQHLPVQEVWYVDLASEKIVRTLKKPLTSVWRDIEATCDDIMLRYQALIARRSRGRGQ